MEIDFMFDQVAKVLSDEKLLLAVLTDNKSPLGQACFREYQKRNPPFYVVNCTNN